MEVGGYGAQDGPEFGQCNAFLSNYRQSRSMHMHVPIGAHLQVEDDGETYTFWEDMLWPPLHSKSARLVSDVLCLLSCDSHRQHWPQVPSKLALRVVVHLEPLWRVRHNFRILCWASL